MNHETELNEFLTRNRVSPEAWERSGLDWDELRRIGDDHNGQLTSLRDTAELFARVAQRFPSVHSVRSRVKDTDHLLEKIVRKRAEGNEKYRNISCEDYFDIVTDLVGIRALHLFKDDCFGIDADIRRTWTPVETPTAYVREGDPPDLTRRFESGGFEVRPHPIGYRSVHYVCSTQPLQRRVLVEIQVRTIFEEGWSEIDHRVRYPSFSGDPLVAYFLTIFNRLAGSADEMGTFVQGLIQALEESESKLADANRQRDNALTSMDKVLSELESVKKQDAETSRRLTDLQQQVVRLRGLPSYSDVLADRIGKRGLTTDIDRRISGVFETARAGSALQQLRRLSEQTQGSQEAIRKFVEQTQGSQETMRKLAEQAQGSQEAMRKLADQTRGLQEAMRKLPQQAQGSSEIVRKLNEQTKEDKK